MQTEFDQIKQPMAAILLLASSANLYATHYFKRQSPSLIVLFVVMGALLKSKHNLIKNEEIVLPNT